MTSATSDDGPEGGEFEAPPAGAVRREEAEGLAEEASVEFRPPDAEAEAEEAAVAPTAEGLEGVPSAVIEAKGELEQRLLETVQEAPRDTRSRASPTRATSRASLSA